MPSDVSLISDVFHRGPTSWASNVDTHKEEPLPGSRAEGPKSVGRITHFFGYGGIFAVAWVLRAGSELRRTPLHDIGWIRRPLLRLLTLRARIRTQPQRNVRRLHRLLT